MLFGTRNAQTVFDKITQRNSCLRNLISSSYSTTTSCCESIEYEEPTDIFRKTNNVISWTAKISTLLRKNQPKEAIGLFKAMLFDDQKPNFVTLLSIIRAYGARGSQDGKRVVHGYVIKMGFEREVPVLTAILGFYSNFGMAEVWKLFDQIPNKDVVVWTSMIVSCTKNDNSREAIEVFRRMKCCGVEPNFVTVVSVLPACAHLGQLRLGKEIHGFIMKNMLHSLINIQNSLVDMYAKCGDLESSFRVFDGTWNKELITWRIIIRGCIDNGCPRKGLDIFLKMLLSCSGSDEVVLQDVIAAASLAEELKFGLGCHVYAAKAGFLAFVSVGTALLQMYGKYGELQSAWKLLNELSEKDNIAWNAMISVYAQEGQPQNALNVLKQMVSQNEKPDEVSFVSLLKACSATGDQALGESFHGYVIKAGYTSNAYLASALIDLYCKLGKIEEGEALFNEISTKDLICWSSMITGYGSNGFAYEALETFSKMLDCGIKPNDIAFLSVLSASSRGGLKNESFKLFNTMQQKFGLRPKLAHYACMVDLLCRHGNIKEALDFVKNMPLEADKRIWGAILAGCRTRQEGSIEVAEYAVERLSTLDPGNPRYYLTLLYLYSKEGTCEEEKSLQKLANQK
ncbi:hypothetical protein K2173_025268 [Erythroxylum novogranatense]|uniref:Pentatricopeptide repeat-containing protein n=1 Tax=Erythroxylum novogranatense TaxID=1862640 RepID=A0AAV8UIK1_9ROSI|nr:hypothetical protein K2173_025268 [Erythroxylum novogranatense]